MYIDHLKDDIFSYNKGAMFRSLYKLILFSILVVTFFSLTIPGLILFFVKKDFGRNFLDKVTSLHSQICLYIFDVQLEIKGLENIKKKKGSLIVANHMSYIDIISLASIYKSLYVTSTEMRDTPFLGQIVRAAGCVFVDRKSQNNRERELKDLTRALKAGGLVTIFPEATSTNGESVLKFKHGLFDAPLIAKTTTTPVTINYKSIDADKVSAKNRDNLCWYGDMTFFSHFIKFLSLKNIVIEIRFHKPLMPNNFSNKTELANKSHEIVSKSFSNLS